MLRVEDPITFSLMKPQVYSPGYNKKGQPSLEEKTSTGQFSRRMSVSWGGFRQMQQFKTVGVPDPMHSLDVCCRADADFWRLISSPLPAGAVSFSAKNRMSVSLPCRIKAGPSLIAAPCLKTARPLALGPSTFTTNQSCTSLGLTSLREAQKGGDDEIPGTWKHFSPRESLPLCICCGEWSES